MMMACQSQYVSKPNYPSEAALVANAVDNGMSTELDIPYKEAYLNLKQAYQRCVAFTTDEELVFTDNRLEEDIELATMFAKTDKGEYLQKATIESIAPNKTRLTLFLPKEFKFAKTRFKQDINRALGKDRECNIGREIPIN